MTATHPEREHRRLRGDDGAAVVELALVSLVLATLLFGIIGFGYLFSLRQNMTQAAAEGARAAAVAATANQTTDATQAVNDAVAASFGRQCDGTALTCSYTLINCPYDPSPTPKTCAKVTITYDYAHYGVLRDTPIVSQFIPSTFTVSATARVS